MNYKQTMIAGVFTGIGASLCCVAPLLLISLGFGGAWLSTLTLFEPLRPIFIVLGFPRPLFNTQGVRCGRILR